MIGNSIVRVGGKSQDDYLAACLFSLNQKGFVKVEGLGRWTGKVYSIVKELNASKSIETMGPEFFKVDGTHGIRYRVYKEENDNGIEIEKGKE